MSEDATPRLALPMLAAGQAQKEVLVNEALQRLDALVQPVALSATLAVPPASPAEGACWIVAAGASGTWTGYDNALAQWTAGGWRFAAPAEGWRCIILDSAAVMIFQSGSWRLDAIRGDGLYIGNKRVIGARVSDIAEPAGGTIVDVEARSVINLLLSMLREHGLIGS